MALFEIAFLLRSRFFDYMVKAIAFFALRYYVLGDPEVTANLYCYYAYLYWEGCVICSIYLR